MTNQSIPPLAIPVGNGNTATTAPNHLPTNKPTFGTLEDRENRNNPTPRPQEETKEVP